MALRMGTTVAGQIRKRVRDARVAQMLDHFVQYVGSSPYGSPGGAVRHRAHADRRGRLVPDGRHARGAGGAGKARTRAGRGLPDRHRRGAHHHAGGRASGIETDDGERIACSAVVSNMDSVRTYRELVGGVSDRLFAKRWKRDRRHVPAWCCISGWTARTSTSRITTSSSRATRRRSSTTSTSVASRRRIRPATWPRPRAPSRTWHRPAARRCTCWCTRPICGRITTGRRCCRTIGRTILDKLKRCAGMQDIEDRIRVERHLTPQDIHDRYRVLNGAIYGLASHGTLLRRVQAGQPLARSAGLYLAGGAAHPGPGMPMVLMSGWIAADSVDADCARARRCRRRPRMPDHV